MCAERGDKVEGFACREGQDDLSFVVRRASGKLLVLVVAGGDFHAAFGMGAEEVVDEDGHRVVFAAHRHEAEVGGEDVLAGRRVGIVALRAGVVALRVVIVGPVEVAVVIVVAAFVETAAFFLEFDFVFGENLLFACLHEVRTGIGGEIAVKRQLDAVDGTRLGVDQRFQVDGVGLPFGEVVCRIIVEEDRFAGDEAADTHEVACTVEVVHLEELPDVLFEYLDDAHDHAAKVDGLEGYAELRGLGDDHAVADKADVGQGLVDFDLPDDAFAEGQAVLAAYVFIQVDVQCAFGAGVGIEAEFIAVYVDGVRLVFVDPGEALHILGGVEEFREGDFDVAFGVRDILHVIDAEIVHRGDVDRQEFFFGYFQLVRCDRECEGACSLRPCLEVGDGKLVFLPVGAMLPDGIGFLREADERLYGFGRFLVGGEKGADEVVAVLILLTDIEGLEVTAQGERQGGEVEDEMFVFAFGVEPFGEVGADFVAGVALEAFGGLENDGPVVLEGQFAGCLGLDADQLAKVVRLDAVGGYRLVEDQVDRRVPGDCSGGKGLHIRAERQLLAFLAPRFLTSAD